MKTIDLKRRKPSLEQALKMASKEEIVLRTARGREFVLAEVDDFDHESAQMCKNKALMKVLERRFKEKGKRTLAEVRKRLGIE
jgi:hypothetical protein